MLWTQGGCSQELSPWLLGHDNLNIQDLLVSESFYTDILAHFPRCHLLDPASLSSSSKTLLSFDKKILLACLPDF